MEKAATLPASARAMKDLMDVWDDVKAKARQLFPDASEEDLVAVTRSVMDLAVKKVLAK